MRAVVISRFGPPAVLEPVADWPDPTPGPGQVLVRAAAASITFVETQVRAGRAPHPAMRPELPAVLGNGVGGLVEAVGADVDPGLVGRRVVTTTGGRGGYAQRAAVPADGLVPVPDGLSVEQATALLADGRTAVLLSDAARPAAGETVVVEAAAGGVGGLLVQLAVRSGARVVALAGGERKLGHARELGAQVAIDYRRADWAAELAREVGPVDVVFDGVGGQIGAAAFESLAPGGRYAGFGWASGSAAELPADRRPDVDRLGLGPITSTQSVELTGRALALAADGAWRPTIGQRFDLDRAAEAHAAIEARQTVGKTLLSVLD